MAAGCASRPDELDVGNRAPPGCSILPAFTADGTYSAVWHDPGFAPLEGGPLPVVTSKDGGPVCITWKGGGSVWVNSRTGFWDEQVTVSFLILIGEPIPASVLKHFPVAMAQRTQMASQHRVLVVALCPVTNGQVVFLVHANVDMQSRIGYNASLSRELARVVAPTITGTAISDAPQRLGTTKKRKRRQGTVRGKGCTSKVTLTHYDGTHKKVFCPSCVTLLNFVDRPCTGVGENGCSHAPNGDAQSGWRLTQGSLVHSADCVNMGSYATSQQDRMTPFSRSMIAAAQKSGVGASVAPRLVSTGNNADSAITPSGVRYEMRRQLRVDGPPPPPPSTSMRQGQTKAWWPWLPSTTLSSSAALRARVRSSNCA